MVHSAVRATGSWARRKRPEGLAKLLVSYLRWSTRDNAYVSLLTDEYPPFSGDESSQAAARHAAFSPGDGMLASPH